MTIPGSIDDKPMAWLYRHQPYWRTQGVIRLTRHEWTTIRDCGTGWRWYEEWPTPHTLLLGLPVVIVSGELPPPRWPLPRVLSYETT